MIDSLQRPLLDRAARWAWARAAGLAVALQVMAICGSLLPAYALADEFDAERFTAELQRAERLNVEAPWRESQSVLDSLRPHLDLATAGQKTTYLMLESRNQALAGDLEASLATVERVLERDLELRQRVAAHARAANVAHIARAFEETFHHLNEALELLENPGAEPYGNDVYSLAAYMYTLVGELDAAEDFGRKAVRIAEQRGQPREVCTTRQRLAFVHKTRGEFEPARHHYETARPACIEAGDRLVAAVVDYGLADLLASSGRYDEAEPRFERALAEMEQLDYSSGLAEAYLYKARMTIARGRGETAEVLLTRALPILERAGNDEYIAEAHRWLADLDRGRNRPEDAIEHLEASMQAQQTHQDQVRDRQTAFLRVRFAMADQERELALLRELREAEAIEDRARAQQARLRAGIAVLAVLLATVLLVLWIRAVRDRRRFRRLSQRDALTALSNHTRFFELAERTRALSREKHRPFTLILADIDHFKKVNDQHGHLVGDQVLRQIAELLRINLGKFGIIGRVGGEEFGIALPGVEREQVRQRLDQLRRELITVTAEGGRVPITMSFGAASSRGDESLTELRKRADHRLYAAKQAGRDRVVDEDRDG